MPYFGHKPPLPSAAAPPIQQRLGREAQPPAAPAHPALRQGVAPQSRALCQLWDCVPGHAGGQFPIPDWASADVWTLYPMVCQCWL